MKKNLIKSECPNCQALTVGGTLVMMLCPTHAAADALLAACKGALEQLDGLFPKPQPGDWGTAGWESVENLRAAIALAAKEA